VLLMLAWVAGRATAKREAPVHTMSCIDSMHAMRALKACLALHCKPTSTQKLSIITSGLNTAACQSSIKCAQHNNGGSKSQERSCAF
jgi:hypothetical protein